MKHKTWIYKGTFLDDTIIIVVEYAKNKYVSFCADGTYMEFSGAFDLAKALPGSWEYVE